MDLRIVAISIFVQMMLLRPSLAQHLSATAQALDKTASHLSDPKSTSAAKESKDARIIVLGDSLTAGYGIEKEEAFPALLEKRLQNLFGKAISVVNAGVSGSTTASGLSRLKWQLKAKPTHLILALGANDGLRGFKLDETRKNLEEIIKLAEQEGIKVLLAGMQLPPNYGAAYRKQFEDIFATLAKAHRLEFMPFLLVDVAGEAKLNLSDGIHPNPEGHKIIADKLEPFVLNLLKN